MNLNIPSPDANNSYWQAQLRQTPGLQRCPLPKDIEFSGDHNEVTLRLKASSAQSNMQTDSAAFDAWALALLTHCGVDRINLEVQPEQDPRKPHFQRFLYRAHRFAELFPIRGNYKQYESRALNESIVKLLNQPERRTDTDPETLQEIAEKKLAACSEHELELALTHSEEFERAFKLDKQMRQWPVGLFASEVKRGKNNDNLIFTGGKSAIDLIGISGDTLVIFELKKSRNRKAGSLSELLFYTNVFRDVLHQDKRFEFEDRPGATGNKMSTFDVRACRRIKSVLLAPDFHPLLWNDNIDSSASVVSKLNAAIADKWEIPATFEVVKLLGNASGLATNFQFRASISE